MLREELKRELDKLNDEQLKKIADYITFLEFQAHSASSSPPSKADSTSAEKAQAFRQWISQLPQNGLSLPDEAFNRDNIYAE
jgi:hypothetical protein